MAHLKGSGLLPSVFYHATHGAEADMILCLRGIIVFRLLQDLIIKYPNIFDPFKAYEVKACWRSIYCFLSTSLMLYVKCFLPIFLPFGARAVMVLPEHSRNMINPMRSGDLKIFIRLFQVSGP